MHFTHAPHAAGSKSTKLAVVIVFHVILGMALVKTMNVRLLNLPAVQPPVELVPTLQEPVIPPPLSAPQVRPVDPPVLVVPMPEVPVSTPPLTNTVTTTTTTTVTETTPTNAGATATAIPPAGAGAGTGTGTAAVRMAAMMDGCAKPAYPAQAARNGDTGTVTLALLVGVDGRVTGSRVERSSGFRDLDKAALTALSLCKFKPAMRGDVAEAGWAQIAFTWQLD